MAMYAMNDILKFILIWETGILKSYHDIQRIFGSDPELYELMKLLEKDQNRFLESLRAIDLESLERVEFIKNIKNYSADPPARNVDIAAETSIGDILDSVMSVHEDLLLEYAHLRGLASFEKSRDIFDALIQLKTAQLKKIRSYMESCRHAGTERSA